MLYACLGLIILVVLLSLYILFLRRAISETIKQMEEIEQKPERNRKLKAITADTGFQKLLSAINKIYLARQEERIVYQRNETKIRKEVENISHDLRTPLTSILGYLELMEESNSEEEKQEFLEIIRKRARLLQGFIQDFYEISITEGDNYPIILENVEVQGMLKDSMIAYFHEFERKQLGVSIELEDDPAFIIVDKIQFNRILNNLVQNVLKYAKEKFILQQYCSQGYCVIQFKNDRSNITEEELKVIFERFYTGDQSRSNQSRGLGLTITKLLVEKMKGQIEARLEDGLFIIELRWRV
ncbi:MAG TPA: HAMP domain-containing histidine kinase [Clostridiales bacterium]|nr:HAMP domain-containing histidine kinase [Clostridiales bacterium]